MPDARTASDDQRVVPRPRRFSPRIDRAAATAAFGFLGVVLLLGPDLVAGAVDGVAPEPFDLGLEAAFIVIGCVLVWVLAGRIVEAFLLEADERAVVERRETVLAEVLDVVPAAVLVLSGAPANLVVAHANPAAASLFGVEAARAPGGRLADVCPLDTDTSDVVAAALAGGAGWRGERVVAAAEGRQLSLALAVVPIRGDAGRAVLVATDHTRIRFAERESERLATELQGFVEGAPLGFVTVGPDGLVAGWNPAAERILGMKASEMLGRRLPPEIGAAVAEALATGAGAGGATRSSAASTPDAVQLSRAAGEPVMVRLTATTAYGRGHEFFGFTAMFEDMTARRRTEADRDEADRDEAGARFRAAVDAVPVPLVQLDRAGRVRFWSAAAERVFGWTADEAMGEVFPPVPPTGYSQFSGGLERVLAGEMVHGNVIRYVHRDGHTLAVRVWSSSVRAADGSIVGVMGAFGEINDAEEPRA